MRKVVIAIGAVLGAVVVLAAAVAAGTLYHAQIAEWVRGGHVAAAKAPPATAGAAQFYTCSMHPQVIEDHPGKCPICHMDLEPIGNGTTIDPTIVQNMGLRVAKVSTGPLHTTLHTVGSFVEPEQNHVEINLRVSGWIQKLYANQDGMAVAKGDKLFDLYSADLTAAADELIAARKAAAGVTGNDSTVQSASGAIVAAARRKLELLGLPAADVEAIAAMDKAPATVTFTCPIAGHVTEKTVVEGSAVKAGDRVMRIADRSTLWLQVQVYEQQLPLVHVGTPVRAIVEGLPGKALEGTIEFIYPHLDMMARTATMRVVVPNPGHALHEGMYARVEIDAAVAERAVLVPREAVIDSGTRQIVFLAEGGGHFEPRNVSVGQTGHGEGSANDDMVEVISGLSGDETVVTSGQFLLDSDSRMKEAIEKHLRDRLAMAPGGPKSMPSAATASAATSAAAAALPSDGIIRAYLGLQRALVGADKPVETAALAAQAEAAANLLPAGDAKSLANAVASEARAMAGEPVDKQREAFKDLSAEVIRLVQQSPPSAGVAPALFELHCPMAKADWLQTTEETANPYLPDMLTCGSVTRKYSGGTAETRP